MIDKALKYKKGFSNRKPKPLEVFVRSSEQFELLMTDLEIKQVSETSKTVVLKNSIINQVSLMEVYFKDMLMIVLNTLSDTVSEGILNQLHPKKYRISEIIEMNRHSVSPYEMIVQDQNFQNLDNIERVYSKLLNKPFKSVVLKANYRIVEISNKVIEFSIEELDRLKELIEYRHELVHNLEGNSSYTNNEIFEMILSLHRYVMISELILQDFINKNKITHNQD